MILYSIYIIDDEPIARESLAIALERNYSVRKFPAAENAIKVMEKEPADLILLDIGLPGMSGIEAIQEIRQTAPDSVIIMITGYEDVKTVVSAMKSGAYDYVTKPVHTDALMITVRNALETVRMRKEIQAVHERYLKENIPCFIGESNAIQDVMDVVRKVARSRDTSILIIGETGTGKELIAKAIHYRSPNSECPMICVNCAAIPKELIESELFGYEKGAFSGAVSLKKGLVEQSEGGTLFLDEVGDLSPEAQAKLLRFLETGEFYRVGSVRTCCVQTRIISATNKNLIRMMEQGDFREDLYYRLAVVKVEIPSLNERRDDILPIARHFLAEFSQKFGKSFTGISRDAETALKNFIWRGNVRELRNIIEKGALMGEGPELKLRHISEGRIPYRYSRVSEVSEKSDICFPAIDEDGFNLPEFLEFVESYYLRKALEITQGNDCQSANLLKLSRDAFRYRKKRLKIKR